MTTRLIIAVLLAAQTAVTPPKNKYSPAEDVKLGQEAAAQVEQQLPIMRDDLMTSFVDDLGRRLVAAIPPALQQPEFRYTFKAVNVREINAFALPGGPMFVNRGMIEAAKTEGEVIGVMAHEISHVVLRHGTAQASAATKYEIGAVAGAVLGAILGGRLGTVVSEGSRFGLGAYFMKFSREYEKQADIQGAQIMARAGYDPIEMANMFKTIEKQASGGGPEWLSDHPNPGNRSDYISKEAKLLRVTNPVTDTRTFDQVKAHLKQLPKAPTTEEATRNNNRSARTGTGAPPAGSVPPPETRYTQYTEGNLFKVRVPSNWRELPGSSAVTFAPPGATGTINGQDVFTHGVELGVSRNESHDLRTATDELISSLGRGNPNLRRAQGEERGNIGGRTAVRTMLENRSDATGRAESIALFSTLLSNGNLFYVIGVAPLDEFPTYNGVFQRVVNSIQFVN